MRRLVIALIALLVVAALDAGACECGKRWPVEKQFASAAIVFAGRVELIHQSSFQVRGGPYTRSASSISRLRYSTRYVTASDRPLSSTTTN